MKRMEPHQLIEQALYSLSSELGDDDTDLRTIAFALCAITADTSTGLPEKYNFERDDVAEYTQSLYQSDDEVDYQKIIDAEMDTRTDTRSIPEPKRERPVENRKSNIIIPRDVNELKHQPLVPKQRVNKWYDDGKFMSEMRTVDKKIIRPDYEFGRRPPADNYVDTRCIRCRGEFSISSSELDEFSGEGQLYEKGYVCAGCARGRVDR